MKSLSFKDYPFVWSVQEAIQNRVNYEAELMINDKPRELRPDTSKHPMQLSEVAKRALAWDMAKFLP